MLFVHLNSSLHANVVFYPFGLNNMHLAPAPLLDLDPLKNNFQNNQLTTILSTKFIHSEVSV